MRGRKRASLLGGTKEERKVGGNKERGEMDLLLVRAFSQLGSIYRPQSLIHLSY